MQILIKPGYVGLTVGVEIFDSFAVDFVLELIC